MSRRQRAFVVAGTGLAIAGVAVGVLLFGGRPDGDSDVPEQVANQFSDGNSSGGQRIPTVLVATPAGAAFEEALARGAAEYATQQGVSQEEAAQRLRWQLAASDAVQEIQFLAPGRFVGLWVEHQPEWKAIAWFVGSREGLDEVFSFAETAPFPLEIRTGATHTAEQLDRAHQAVGSALEDDQLAGSYIDVGAGEIVILVLPGSDYEADAARFESEWAARYGVPFRIEVSGPAIRNNGEGN